MVTGLKLRMTLYPPDVPDGSCNRSTALLKSHPVYMKVQSNKCKVLVQWSYTFPLIYYWYDDPIANDVNQMLSDDSSGLVT